MTGRKAIELLKRIVGPTIHDREWSCMKGTCERCDAISEAQRLFKEAELKAAEQEQRQAK